MRLFALLALTACLAACASTYDDVLLGLNDLPTRKQPAYITSAYESGKITQAQRDQLMQRSEKAALQEQQEAAVLAKMTPEQQTQYRFQRTTLATEEAEQNAFRNDAQNTSNQGFRAPAASPNTGMTSSGE